MASYKLYSDEELITLLQKGERHAFDEIYDRFWDKLFVTATNRLGDADEAEDLIQDVMLHLWNNQATISIQTSLSTYLAVAGKYEVLIIWQCRNVIGVMLHQQTCQKRRTALKILFN